MKNALMVAIVAGVVSGLVLDWMRGNSNAV